MALALVAPLTDVDDPPLFLQQHGTCVREALRRSAPVRSTRIGSMAAYHMGWADARGNACEAESGKLLRAGFTLWAANAVGGDAADALDAAVAVEWIHNFTLVHDDIQDGDRERRHRATLWTVVGEAQAINAGDALHAVAQRLLTSSGRHPDRRLRAARVLADATLAVIEGQCLDLALERRPPSGIATALRLARAKTGALIGGALEAGALMGGATAPAAMRLGRAGRQLGAAFQLRDDWLGTWGDPALTGKSCEADLQRRKHTYAVAIASEVATRPQRRELWHLMRSRDPLDTLRLRALLDELDAGARTAAASLELAGEGLRLLEHVVVNPGRRAEARELAAYVASRRR